MDDKEKPNDEATILDLEEASPVEEVLIPDEPVHLNEELCNKLLDLPLPKVFLTRAGVKSFCMEHMVLLGKMDPCRLEETQNISMIVTCMNVNIT